jgi:hypothetical protein
MSNSERPRSYVGVSGVVKQRHRMPSGIEWHEWQHQFLQARAAEAGLFVAGRALALGVKATHKTQIEGIENKYGRDWYPVGDEFSDAINPKLLTDDTLTVAQAYLDIDHVGDPDYRRQFVRTVADRGRPWLQAIQFDMLPWNRDDQYLEFLEELHENHDLKILLQCHQEAMEELGPKGVVRKLGRYAADIDYILFDASHGKGERMNAAALDGFLNEAYSSSGLEEVGFAVAGGLNARNVREDLPQLIAKYPDLSWDAEGQLHPLNNIGTRPMQIDVTTDYLRASVDTIVTK